MNDFTTLKVIGKGSYGTVLLVEKKDDKRVERFNEEAVKFYGAQLVLALDHLHKNNIIYRE